MLVMNIYKHLNAKKSNKASSLLEGTFFFVSPPFSPESPSIHPI
jgi:hypothetical protein